MLGVISSLNQFTFNIDKKKTGDKSNHIPSLHIPQLYYFLAFATLFGWPVLISGELGLRRIVRDVCIRMFGTKRCVFPCLPFPFFSLTLKHSRVFLSAFLFSIMAMTVHKFTSVFNTFSSFFTYKKLNYFHKIASTIPFYYPTTDTTPFMSGVVFSCSTPRYLTCLFRPI